MKNFSRLAPRFVFALCCLPWTALAALPTIPAPTAAPASTTGGLLQALFGMLAVLALIFACAWLARRFGLQRITGSTVIKMISSSAVGQRERIVVVEVDGTWLVLGVTAHQINTLHTLPAQSTTASSPAFSEDLTQKMATQFAARLRQAMGKAGPTNS